MENQELIERLKRDTEDWKEQAILWENLSTSKDSRRDAKALAKRCRTKADQWAEVIKLLQRD